MTNDSARLAALEVMVEMLTAHNMMMEAAPDQAMDDYRDVAVLALSQRRPESELDGLVSALDERLVKVRQHLEIVRELQARERVQ